MRRGVRAMILCGLAAACAGPVAAQQFTSQGYDFLKAVKDRDGQKVTDALNTPGTTVITAKDDTGQTALHIVAKRRDLTWLQFLLAKGAPMNARDRDGETPLMAATRIGFSDGEQQLLDVGAQVDLANNRGETPLIVATQTHDLASVRVLLQYGANPKEQDHVAGLSALDYAQRDSRSGAILKMLQEAKPVAKKQVSGPALN
jgi:ankyrin repeat protein